MRGRRKKKGMGMKEEGKGKGGGGRVHEYGSKIVLSTHHLQLLLSDVQQEVLRNSLVHEDE